MRRMSNEHVVHGADAEIRQAQGFAATATAG
jgi:hypothetical protein